MLSQKFYDELAKQMNKAWTHSDRNSIIERVAHYLHCQDDEFDEHRFKKKSQMDKVVG